MIMYICECYNRMTYWNACPRRAEMDLQRGKIIEVPTKVAWLEIDYTQQLERAVLQKSQGWVDLSARKRPQSIVGAPNW